MAATVEVVGRGFQLNESSLFERSYFVRDAADEEEASLSVVTYLQSELGPSMALGGLVLRNLSGAEPVKEGFTVTASWGVFQRREPLATGESSFNFEIGIEPVRVIVPLDVTVYKRATDTDPTPTGLHIIGDQGDGEEPQGVEIYEPVHTESETHIIAASSITSGYKAAIKTVVGKTNNAAFKGHSAGECLMQSVSGQRRGADDWELNFRWAVKENQTSLNVAGITVASRKGWQYLWPRYQLKKDEAGAPVLTRQIKYVIVNTVFQSANFAALGIGV